MPPSTAATKAFRPYMMPMSGSIFGICMPMSTPAAAASAEPRAKVIEMIQSVEMPMRRDASRLNETARIALPVRVFRMKKRSRSIRRKDDDDDRDLLARQAHARDDEVGPRGERRERTSGSGPKTSCATFSMKSETPMAVMSSVSRASRRTGR